MKSIRWSVVAVSVVSLLVSAVPVFAQTTVGECQAVIFDLRTATDDATVLGRSADKDEAGLLGKLDSASTKLSEGKFEDALQALTQFRNKVAALEAQGKLEPAEAAVLTAGANDASVCIQALPAGA